MINHFNTREAIVKSAKDSDKIKTVTDNIFQLFESDTKAWWFSDQDYINAGKEIPQENKDLSVMDLYYWKEIKDDDLSLLSWFLWGWEYVRKNVDWEYYITHEWLVKLNNILDMASKHARRKWLWTSYFRKNFWKESYWVEWPKKWLDIMDFVWENRSISDENWSIKSIQNSWAWKVYFRIKNKEDYLKLLDFLTTQNKDFSLNEKNGFFLKNVVALWYLWRNDAYLQKRKLFQYLITDVFWKFFNYKFNDVLVNTDVHWDHWHNITETFMGNIGWKDAEITLNWNVKSERSTINKIMREKKANATNDIIRFQLTFSNHDELVHGLYDFLNFYKNDSWHVFDHGTDSFWSLMWFDKWCLNSENRFYNAHLENLPNWDIKDFIKNINYNRKKWSSSDYKDVKLIVPVILKWIPFNVEIKFVTKDYETFNDRGYSSHAILKWAEMIESICRHKKFITEYEIKKIVDDIIQESPELIDQISKWNEEDLHEELFDYFINKCEKINIPWHKTVYMFKDIKDTLTKYSFWPHIKEEDN